VRFLAILSFILPETQVDRGGWSLRPGRVFLAQEWTVSGSCVYAEKQEFAKGLRVVRAVFTLAALLGWVLADWLVQAACGLVWLEILGFPVLSNLLAVGNTCAGERYRNNVLGNGREIAALGNGTWLALPD
jgi:hypothetical protein